MHDLSELNNLFDAEMWLRENYGCEFYPSSNNWLTSSCPFSDHDDSSPSFGINKEKNIFNCFGCGKNGDFIALVQLISGFDFSKTIKFMAEYSNVNLKVYSSDVFIYSTKLINSQTLEIIQSRLEHLMANPPNVVCVNVILNDVSAMKFQIVKEIVMNTASITEQEAEWYILMAGVESELKKLALLGVRKNED